MNALLNDPEVLDFVKRQAKGARYVTSVCTARWRWARLVSFKGKRATTHWMSREMLTAFGATPVAERVVIDGNVITGGGVTAGIDFALAVAAEAFGEERGESDPAEHRIRPASAVRCGHARARGRTPSRRGFARRQRNARPNARPQSTRPPPNSER